MTHAQSAAAPRATAASRRAWLAFLLLGATLPTLADSPALELHLDKDGAGAVLLQWKGGAPTYGVFRATSPEAVDAPDHQLAETRARAYTDAGAQGPIHYYLIGARGDCWSPLGDASIEEKSPTENFGTSTKLTVDAAPNGGIESLLRFSMDGLDRDAVVESATLWLELLDSNQIDGVIELAAVDGDWGEASVTWSSRPDVGDVWDAPLIAAGTGQRSWDATELVRQWIDGTQSNFGLVLRAVAGKQTPHRMTFASREAGDAVAPRLCITWTSAAQMAYDDLQRDSTAPISVHRENETTSFVDADVPVTATDPVDAALEYLDRYPALYGLDAPRAELFLDRLETHEDLTTVRFGRRVDNTPVPFEHLSVFVEPGRVLGTAASYEDYQTDARHVASPSTTPHQAAKAAPDATPELSDVRVLGAPRLEWYRKRQPGTPLHLAWRLTTAGLTAAGESRFQTVYLDAASLDVLEVFSEDRTGDRPGEDFEIKTVFNTESSTCWRFTSESRETWFDENGPKPAYPGPAGDLFSDGQFASDALHATYHYFFDEFNCPSWNCDGTGITAMVHAVRPEWNNAAVRSLCGLIVFGDGWATDDIVGHEFTHVLTRNSSALRYVWLSGALNESYSDYFGAMIEGDWVMGEDRRDTDAQAIRDMSDPTAFDDPDHMDSLCTSDAMCQFTTDANGVHTNSGIPNKVAYLITDGGMHNGLVVGGLGRVKAPRLYFSVLWNSRLIPDATFMDQRLQTIAEARRFQSEGRHGFTVSDVCDVINAFASVGLGDPDTDCDGTADPPSGDRDGDGFIDARDNCPNRRNPYQDDMDGDGVGDRCDLDRDGDGVVNTEDNCPTVPNDQSDVDGDGIGDLCEDFDRDGVYDRADNCWFTWNPGQENMDGDGLGDACDANIDGDAWANDEDNCELVFQSSQDDVDLDGRGDVCDNCVDFPNADQADRDRDGTGDVCDADRDGDGIANADDNCQDDFNPDQFDNDGNGIGLICDAEERSFLDGLALADELMLVMTHRDVNQAMRIPIFPCTGITCPDRMSPDMVTQVAVTTNPAYFVRIVDDTGHVVDQRRPDGTGTYALEFPVDHEFYYKDGPNATPFEGRRYFLEFFAPPGSKNGQLMTGSVAVDTFLEPPK